MRPHQGDAQTPSPCNVPSDHGIHIDGDVGRSGGVVEEGLGAITMQENGQTVGVGENTRDVGSGAEAADQGLRTWRVILQRHWFRGRSAQDNFSDKFDIQYDFRHSVALREIFSY